MIYVDIEHFTPSLAWQHDSDTLSATLLNIDDPNDRNSFITINASFWSRLKPELPYSDKCWISEAKDVVSPYNIEHFRPKFAITRSASVLRKLKYPFEQQRIDWLKINRYKGSGYWWLAFKHSNFRICGSLINSTKGTRFPIHIGSYVAYQPNDDYNNEQFILLDPTVKGDPELITFDTDGKARPIIVDKHSLSYVRAFASIEIYGLNAIEQLVNQRANKWRDLADLICDINFYYGKINPLLSGDQELDDNLSEYLERFYYKCEVLKERIVPSAEYSSLAKTCLLSFSYEWINSFIL